MTFNFLRRKDKKPIDPGKLLLKQFGLTKMERLEMFIRGFGLSQVAVPVGSFLYFFWLQARYLIMYTNNKGKATTLVDFGLKDTWDRLPIHIDNLFHYPFFASLRTVNAPSWWVIARHDARKVVIGFLVILLIGAITVGFKSRKRASIRHMVASVPLALLGASGTAAVLIVLFAQLPNAVSHFGTNGNIPYVSEWLGKGQVELLVIGVVSGLVAKRILARTFDTLQLMSIERNIAQGDSLDRGWKKFAYGANYRKRYAYIQEEVNQGRMEAHLGSPWIGRLLAKLIPCLLFCLAGGIWVLYFGPAAGH